MRNVNRLIIFDFQGVFETKEGTPVKELYNFLHHIPKNVTCAIVSFLSHNTILTKLTEQEIDVSNIHVYGYEDMTSKAEAIHELQSVWQPQKTIFVTDTVRDILDVQQTNAIIYAVTWGYDAQKYLQRANPHDMLATPKQLIQYLHTSI